jgi:type II secretory pathway component PulF
MNTPSQIDTSAVTNQLARLIAAGTTEHELLDSVARQFPNLERREFLAALHEATESAERQALRRRH